MVISWRDSVGMDLVAAAFSRQKAREGVAVGAQARIISYWIICGSISKAFLLILTRLRFALVIAVAAEVAMFVLVVYLRLTVGRCIK